MKSHLLPMATPGVAADLVTILRGFSNYYHKKLSFPPLKGQKDKINGNYMVVSYGLNPASPMMTMIGEISRPVCQDCGEKALPGYVAGDRCERLAKRNACVPETVCGGRLDEPK